MLGKKKIDLPKSLMIFRFWKETCKKMRNVFLKINSHCSRVNIRVTRIEKLQCHCSGVRGGGPHPPPYACPPERLRGGTHGRGSFNITSACISLPQYTFYIALHCTHPGAHEGGVPSLRGWGTHMPFIALSDQILH